MIDTKKILIELKRIYVHTLRTIRGIPTQSNTAITDSIFVGGDFRASRVKTFVKWGVSGVVNMRSRTPKYKAALEKQSIDFIHLPVVDNAAPTLDQLRQGVAFISQHVNLGGKCYIHCRMGEGRGPTMGTAYLVSEGFTVDDAIDAILLKRPFLKITPSQIARLREFEQQYA